MGQLLAAMAIVLAAVVSKLSGPHSQTYDSTDWLTLTSDRIAVGRIVSSTAVPLSFAEVADARVHFRVLEWLRGKGSRQDSLYWHGGATWGLPAPDDSVIVFWQLRILQDEGPETLRTATAVDLTRLNRGDRGCLAFTNDYRVFRSAEAVLRAVRDRLALVRAGTPLGDGRHLDVMDFAASRGRLCQWMPRESEARRATGSRIDNSLAWPADAQWLPVLIETTHDSSAYLRGWAATSLAQYPAAQVVPRLREMLADDGSELVARQIVPDSLFSNWTAPVQFYARHSLDALGADTSRARH